jgi:proline dehydrogenase
MCNRYLSSTGVKENEISIGDKNRVNILRFTGAGPMVTEALAMGLPPPPRFWQSILEICDVAANQDTRVWIDAEQQIFQPTIDAWTTDLMRRYNRNGKAQVYTTFQAYLKSTRTRIAQHLELAKKEDWLLGIKLVRGAYIASEHRHLIHDTKAETDDAYNSIAQDLLTQSFPPSITTKSHFPRVNLFLAGHNADSVQKAYNLHRSRVLAGLPTIPLEFGQLQGMADEVSCGLLQLCRQETATKDSVRVAPKAFKCLAWGSTGECMQFLVRRAVENRGSMDRTGEWAVGLRRELWRRMKTALRLRREIDE